MIEEGITALEALGIAIRSEMDAQEVYGRLAVLCEDETHRDRFLNMRQEEKRHQGLLEEMYRTMFPDVALQVPESRLPDGVRPEGKGKCMTVKEVLTMALHEERRSREFYLDCAESTQDISGKRMFRYLADMEFAHQALLAAELELLEKYPTVFEGGKPWQVEDGLRKSRTTR